MCGICGVWRFQGNEWSARSLVENMCATIEHRGPDERGIFVTAEAALGMRRLSIIDLETGSQPVFNESGSVCVVFNGEIYNYRQLRDELEAKGHQFKTQGDTEVIAHLYEEHGIELASKLNGMFAIALWDQTEAKLLLIRDRLGQKPLYYARNENGLVFASEIKAIRAGIENSFSLNHEGLFHYFCLGYVPHPHSIWQGIQSIPPGSVLSVSDKGAVLSKYWELKPHVAPPSSYDLAKEQLRSVVTDAVRLRMIADVPVGAFLSGGIDSSIIVALMSGLTDGRLQTFHIDFAEPEFSEAKYARSVADRWNTNHSERIVRPKAAELLTKIARFSDEPFGDSSALPTFLVSALASQNLKVVLSGDGADEAFGGYRSYSRILKRRALRQPWRKIANAIGTAAYQAMPRWSRGRHYVRTVGMSNEEFFVLGMNEITAREVFSRAFNERIDKVSAFDWLKSGFDSGDASDRLSLFTSHDIGRYLVDDILVKVDRMSMANSLEVRSPFLDYRVIEFAANLPWQWKIHGKQTKRILNDTFINELPHEIRSPRKRGFSLPIASWLKTELRPMLLDAIEDRSVNSSGMFDVRSLRKTEHEHFKGWRDRSDVLWRYLVFVTWWRQTMSERPPAASANSVTERR